MLLVEGTGIIPSGVSEIRASKLQMVMFHAFAASDPAAEKQIQLAARSVRLHYPEAEILLLTNPEGDRAALPGWIGRKARPVDFQQIMFERTLAYRDHVKSVEPGTRIVFLDTDMLVIRRFDELLAPGADLAVTIRQILPAPINGGLIIVDTAQHDNVGSFFDNLVECFERLPAAERRWDGDQTALKQLLDPPVNRITQIRVVERNGLVVRFAPAQVFNHTPRRLFLKLGLFRPGARLLHFKGGRKVRMAAYASRYLSPAYLAYLRLTGRAKGGRR
jgi:hypothetical protein